LKNTPDTHGPIQDIDYPTIKYSKKKIISVFFAISVFSFLIAFPFNQKFENIVRNVVKTSVGCGVNFKELKFEFLLPKIVLNDLQLPQNCFQGINHGINFRQIRLYLRGPSFSPFGIALKLETELLKTDFNIYLALGLNSQAIKFEQQIINFDKFSEFIPQVKMQGQLELNGVLHLKKQNIEKMSGYIRSQNLIIPPQNIQGFNTPELSPRNFVLKIETDVNNAEYINVQEMIMGDQASNIRAKFNGKVVLNNRSLSNSRLDLKGEFALSPEILKEFGIIEQLLSSFNKTDEFYQIQIGGTIDSPQFRSN